MYKLVLLSLLFSLSAAASEINWSLRVLNQKTKEVRNFVPNDGKLEIQLEKGLECSLGETIIGDNEEFYQRTKDLYCTKDKVTMATPVSCGKFKDPKMVKMLNDRTTLILFDKKGSHTYSITLECEV